MVPKASKKYLIMTSLSVFLFLGFTVWWVIIHAFYPMGSSAFDHFSDTYGILAGIGGFIGLAIYERWGGVRSIMGKAVLFFSAGLLAQWFGQLVYTIYFYLFNLDVPYPSLGDVGYFGSIPLYIFGVLYLAKASGSTITTSKVSHKIHAVVLPFLILLVSYCLFLRGYELDLSTPVVTFLDFGYPLGQAIYVSLAFVTYLLSRHVLGGVMKKRVLLVLFALLIQYAADFVFLYQASRETWTAGGINDFMYALSYFVMTTALIYIGTAAEELEAVKA